MTQLGVPFSGTFTLSMRLSGSAKLGQTSTESRHEYQDEYTACDPRFLGILSNRARRFTMLGYHASHLGVSAVSDGVTSNMSAGSISNFCRERKLASPAQSS